MGRWREVPGRVRRRRGLLRPSPETRLSRLSGFRALMTTIPANDEIALGVRMAEATPASPPQAEATGRTGGLHVPIWVVAVVAGFVVLGIGFAVGRRTGDHGDGRRVFGDHGGGRGLGFFVFLVLIALIIAAIVLLVRHFVSRPQGAGSAENLLADRFARGEIDEAEYHTRRAVLRG